MEGSGAFNEGEWDFLTTMFSSDHQEPDFMSHVRPYNQGLNTPSPTFCPSSEQYEILNDSWFYSLDTFNSFTSMDVNGMILPFTNDVLIDETEIRISTADRVGNIIQDDTQPPASVAINPAGNELHMKRKFNVPDYSIAEENDHKSNNNTSSSSGNLKKKTRVSPQHEKKNKTAGSKKSKKDNDINEKGQLSEEDGDQRIAEGCDGQGSCSSYNSDDDNNNNNNNGVESSETTALNSINRKTRASRGSATDPQSLYARKRREKINERLRILQKLVPNGTKVDISTMLEEAVNYVKFLQLQIKLLSSDELWMYAPIAYNGMDIGLHQKISPFL